MNSSTSITSKSISARCVSQVTLATLLAVLGAAPTWAGLLPQRHGRSRAQVNNPLLTAVHAGRKPEMTAMLSK